MNSSLIKIIDISLLPASLMVVGKVIGLFLTVYLFGIPWTIAQTEGAVSSLRPVVLSGDLMTVSTYSDAIMFIFLAIGFTFVLVQATHFHETHISPRMLMRLSTANLMGLVKSSYDIYHSASIWLVFVWLAFGVILINIGAGKTATWLGGVVFIACIVFTSLLLQDVYREIDITRRTLGDKEAF